MVKMNFESAAVDDLFRGPRDRNPGTPRRHDYDVAVRTALQKPDVTIMWKDFWPQLQVCRCFEDRRLRGLHNNGVDFVHENDRRRQMETRSASDVAQLPQNRGTFPRKAFS